MDAPVQTTPFRAYTANLTDWLIYGSGYAGRIGVTKPNPAISRNVGKAQDATATLLYARNLKEKAYELKDHLGDVRVVVSDLKLSTSNPVGKGGFRADSMSVSNYYPFGMLETSRTWDAGVDRYGYNGKEKDESWKGAGVQYDYGFRQYDARLARFLSVDPIGTEYPEYTPYQFAGDSPIIFIDRDGLEPASTLPDAYYIYKPYIDMYGSSSKNRTATGAPRDFRYFWRKYAEQYPDHLSASNLDLIRRGRTPMVDPQWAEHNPTDVAYMNDKLVHHHKDQAGDAVALPEIIHRRYSKELHPIRAKIAGSIAKYSEGLGEIASAYLLISSFLFPDSPHGLSAMLHQMSNEPNILYYDQGADVYYKITSKEVNHVSEYPDAPMVSGQWIKYEMFEGYKKDEKTGKYEGVGSLGRSSVIVDEKYPDGRPPKEGVDYSNN